MDSGHLIGGIVTLVAGLFSLGIGVFKPQRLLELARRKLKTFTLGRDVGAKAAAITCVVFGVLLLAVAALLFILGAVNA